MSYDPTTFQNLYPFPDTKKIRESVESKILSGELKIPDNYILDSKEWIDSMVKDQYRYERNLWDQSELEANTAWQKHQEIEHGFDNLPDNLKTKIHSQVWEDGHSGGYSEMEYRYSDLVPLIIEAYELGRKQGYTFGKQRDGKIVDRF